MGKLKLIGIATLLMSSIVGANEIQVEVPDRRSSYTLPSKEDIQKLEAEVYSTTLLLGHRYPNVDTFVIPPKDHDSVLRFFKKPVVDRKPRLLSPEIGSLKVTAKSGEVFRIPFYWGQGNQPLMFSIRGVRCRDGNSAGNIDAGLALDSIIREVYEMKTGHIVSRPLPRSR